MIPICHLKKLIRSYFLFKVLQDNSIEGQGVARLVTVVKKYDGLTTVDLSGKTKIRRFYYVILSYLDDILIARI